MTQTTQPGIKIDRSDAVLAAQAGMRSAGAHQRYATEVQLAFGRDGKTQRIVHVSKVARGKACGCFCPACSEELVARQGKQLAWHFAHASGGTCKEALSASFAAWLAQALNDGALLSLPPISFRYGMTTISVPGPATPVSIARAVAYQDTPIAPFGVRGMVVTPHGDRPLRIVLLLVEKGAVPSEQEARARGEAVLVLDMRDALKTLLARGEEVVLDEAWLEAALLRGPSARWVWTPKGDRAQERYKETRLGAALKALDKPNLYVPTLPQIQEQLIMVGLDKAVLPNRPLHGEGIMRASVATWRSLFLYDRVYLPLTGGTGEVLLRDVGFSNKELSAWLRMRDLDPLPYGVAKALTQEDWLELGRIRPLRPAFDVVKAYVVLLWEAGVLAAKPWRGTKSGKGPIDPRMAPTGMPFWRPSDATIVAIQKQ